MFEWHGIPTDTKPPVQKHRHHHRVKHYARRLYAIGRDRVYLKLFPVWLMKDKRQFI